MEKKIIKSQIFGTNLDDSDALLPAGFCRVIRNAIPKQGGLSKAGGIQNVPGTTLRDNGSLPSGNSIEIGAYEDRANNRIFYFICNEDPGAEDSIWYFSPNTNTHTKVLQTSYLNFSSSNRISSIDVIEDILVWTDGLNEPRSLKVSDAVAGKYATTSSIEFQISLQKFNPYLPATAAKSDDSALLINNVESDSWQFVYRYVYKDNTNSFFSPPSLLVEAAVYPKVNINTNNRIRVVFPLASQVAGIVKKIQVAYVRNSDGKYFIFNETDCSSLIVGSVFTIYFYNNESVTAVAPIDLVKVNLVPQVSKNVIINNQRIITTLNEYDKNFDDVGTVTFVAVASAITPGVSKIHLPGSTYTYGVVYFDGRMRSSGVVAKYVVPIPTVYATGSQSLPGTPELNVDWTIAGIPPAWAKYYAIVRKRNNTISSVFQTSAIALFYKKEVSVTGLAGADELLDAGKIFYGTKAAASVSAYSGNIWWKLPTNLPVSFDNSYRVRILPNIGQTKTEPIIEVVGDKIITGNFGVTNWSSPTQPFSYPLIQIEKYVDHSDEFFFEVGSIHTITGPTHDDLYGIELGDHYYVPFSDFFFDQSSGGSVDYGFTIGTNIPAQGYPSANIVSQSPTTSATVRETTKKTIEHDRGAGNLFNPAGLPGNLFNPTGITGIALVSDIRSGFTMDYSKISNDNSRAWVEIKNKKTNVEPSTLAISDKYVLNSQVNGLSNFSTFYSLPPNRSPVRKLVNIGASNLFLAIHDRSCTSLATYSGDKILPTSDGSEFQLIGDPSTIIGYDRELQGGYGTIYPDSVVEHGGRVWWFDPYKGEIIRYAAGLTPLALKYKMKTTFRALGNIYMDPNTNGRNVSAGYDPVLQMVYFTFKSTNAAECATWAFVDKEGEERWIGDYDFSKFVTGYSKINNRWFSFVYGKMWEHNVSSEYGNFHGLGSGIISIKTLFNPEWSRVKIARSIGTESNVPWKVTSIIVNKVRENGNAYTQETNLLKADFKKRDDAYYADIMRDRNTFGLSAVQGRVRGDILIGRAYEISMECDNSLKYVDLQAIDISYQDSSGHHLS